MKSLKALWILPLILAAFMVGCPTGGDEYTLRAVELTAGTAVDVEADDTTAEVSFTGASGLTLANEDFTVSEGGTIVSVEVSGDTVTVTVSFAANADTSAEKAYTVGISPDSQVIKGDAAVTITQGYAGDTRRALTAGQPVTVSAADTSAYVVFTGAAGLSTVGGGGEDPLVGSEDFTVNNGAVVSSVAVVEDTVTVTISFAANTGTTEQTYTAGISPDSTVIKGSGTVTITQSGVVLLNAFYVSFSTGNDENAGTEGAPWKTIAKVNSRTYQAGDAILFKRGDTWTWSDGEPSLAPPGSGAEGNPIRISSYGTGAKPVFEGKGLVDNVIHLHNQQYWEISDLEISSMVEGWTNPMARDDTQGNLIKNKDLRAVYISGDNGQVLNGFNLHDLYIHDVTGELNWIGGGAYINNPNPVPFFPGSNNQTGWDASKTTGAIVVYALRGDGVNATIFNNVTVENSVFLRNSFCAFTTKQYHGGSSGTKWAERTVTTYPYADPNFKPHTNIIVRGNYIDQVGFYHGDGIYLTSVQGALVEKNVVKDPGVCGIELYYCDSITVQHNEVYGSTSKGGGGDTNGIDPDVKTSNIIIQYNYVHDNGDGFLVCGNQFNTVIIRYNVLYNNSRMWIRDVVSGGFIQVYNNVLYNTKAQATAGTIQFTGASTAGSDIWEYKNNVFYNGHAGTTNPSFVSNTGYTYVNNMYYGITAPSGHTEATVGDPVFTGAPAFSTGDSAANRFQDFSLLKPGAGSPLINRGVAYSAPESPKRIDVEPNGLDYDGVPVGVA
ncbi:MAG: right-handed parallel beta-helix repeat-containing protein, partial [Treponema sp.]|nr:right-handed parallel beta-helix repeat-containing protein [Treponema sp.]